MTFSFHKSLYSREALIKAAYQFTSRAYVHLDCSENHYVVSIQMKSKKDAISESEFINEMLAQTVRQVVTNETKQVRELLLARALSSTVIDYNDTRRSDSVYQESTEDNIADIITDWFEKYE